MTTLCTAQKQTNLTTSLLQDIPVFHGHDATWLEDWLMDIEMLADITNERANLAKAKSRINPYPNNGSHYLGQILGGYKGFPKAKTLQH